MGPAPTWQPETNRNICYQVLLQKCEFNSLKELINIKEMLIDLVQIAKSSKISYFLNLYDSFLGRDVNAMSHKMLEIHMYSSMTK